MIQTTYLELLQKIECEARYFRSVYTSQLARREFNFGLTFSIHKLKNRKLTKTRRHVIQAPRFIQKRVLHGKADIKPYDVWLCYKTIKLMYSIDFI